MQTTSKIIWPPPHLKENYLTSFFMTVDLTSHGTTDIKSEMLSGVEPRNGTPHDKYNIRGIAHVRTNRNDDIFMQRRLVQSFTFILEFGRRTCTLTKHTQHWTYSTLRHFILAGENVARNDCHLSLAQLVLFNCRI